MSRYNSEQTAYNPQKKKNVPIWKLDTNTVTVTHFNTDMLTEENRPCHTNYIHYSDRLHRIVNEGGIIQYLDELELKAFLCSDAEKMLGLENCFVNMAREAMFECMVYI